MSTLLDIFAAVPPERLVAGSRVDVTTSDGKVWSFVLSEPVSPPVVPGAWEWPWVDRPEMPETPPQPEG